MCFILHLLLFFCLLFFFFFYCCVCFFFFFFFFQAEDGIRDVAVTGVQTCALPILYYSISATGPFVAMGSAFDFQPPEFPSSAGVALNGNGSANQVTNLGGLYKIGRASCRERG